MISTTWQHTAEVEATRAYARTQLADASTDTTFKVNMRKATPGMSRIMPATLTLLPAHSPLGWRQQNVRTGAGAPGSQLMSPTHWPSYALRCYVLRCYVLRWPSYVLRQGRDAPHWTNGPATSRTPLRTQGAGFDGPDFDWGQSRANSRV